MHITGGTTTSKGLRVDFETRGMFHMDQGSTMVSFQQYSCDLKHRAATVLISTQRLWQPHRGDTLALIVLVKHRVAMQNVKWK